MTTLHEQARAEAEKRRYAEYGTDRPAFVDGFLAGHEAAARQREVTTVAELASLPDRSAVRDRFGDVGVVGTSCVHYPETAPLTHEYVMKHYGPLRVVYVHKEGR